MGEEDGRGRWCRFRIHRREEKPDQRTAGSDAVCIWGRCCPGVAGNAYHPQTLTLTPSSLFPLDLQLSLR